MVLINPNWDERTEMTKKMTRKFNGAAFVQFGAVPLRGDQRRDVEQRAREGERIRLRPVADGAVAFIHPNDLSSNPA